MKTTKEMKREDQTGQDKIDAGFAYSRIVEDWAGQRRTGARQRRTRHRTSAKDKIQAEDRSRYVGQDKVDQYRLNTS
jgi:hypothetical protein